VAKWTSKQAMGICRRFALRRFSINSARGVDEVAWTAVEVEGPVLRARTAIPFRPLGLFEHWRPDEGQSAQPVLKGGGNCWRSHTFQRWPRGARSAWRRRPARGRMPTRRRQREGGVENAILGTAKADTDRWGIT